MLKMEGGVFLRQFCK